MEPSGERVYKCPSTAKPSRGPRGRPETLHQHLEALHAEHPELLPERFPEGFRFHDKSSGPSTKRPTGHAASSSRPRRSEDQIRPSFVLPYMAARTEEVEKALYLRHWGVPFDALAYVFGGDPMFWYRAEMALGRPSPSWGATVEDPTDKLPQHLLADEKHSRGARARRCIRRPPSEAAASWGLL